MWELLKNPSAQALLVTGLVFVVTFFGYRLALALRPSISKDDTAPTDMVGYFEDLQSQGGIDANELRNIKAVLGKTPPKS